MSDLTQAFGERLLVARFNYHHITQETLADRAGVHRTQITLLEGGRRQPLLETLLRLAGGCGVGTGELLGPIRWEPGPAGKPGRFVLTEDDAAPPGATL